MDLRVCNPIPLYFETGMYYMNKGYKYYSYFIDGKRNHNNDFLYIPLLLSYHIYVHKDMTIQPFAGIYSGCIVNKYIDDRFHIGGRFGCGINYKRAYFNAGYDTGLNKDAFVSIGYNFIAK